MATISENKKGNKKVSYRFVVCLGRDAQGKQIRRFKTWKAPEGLSSTKKRKAAQKAAEAWEQEVRTEYQKEQAAVINGQVCSLPPEKRNDNFAAFVNKIWLPLQVKGGNNKPARAAEIKKPGSSTLSWSCRVLFNVLDIAA